MSGIKHRPLTSPVAGDSEDNYTDDESTPLTHEIYNERYITLKSWVQNTIPNCFQLNVFLSQRTIHETKGWDVFRDPPLKVDSGSTANQACLDITVRILKVFAYLITFILVLCGGVIGKGSVLFMTSQIKRNKKVIYCNKDLVIIIKYFYDQSLYNCCLGSW